MSRHVFALLLSASALVTSRGSSVELEKSAWWLPVSGVLKVYDINDDLFPEAPPYRSSVQKRHLHVSLIEESVESVVETEDVRRAHVGGETGAIGGGHGAILAAGSGSGAWKTADTKVTFAGANAATKKVADAAATSNALVANAEAGKVDAAKKVEVDATKKQIPAAIGWMAWIRLSMSLGFVVKSMCMVCNIFYQASPLPLIQDYRTKGTTGGADLAPFIAICYGGWQWCFYGIFAYIVTGKSGFLVLVYSNFVGATLGLYYVYSFTINCKNAAMLDKSTKYYMVVASIVATQMVAIATIQPVRALFFSGLISSAWSTVASASLIVTVPVVYETKNSKTLPVPLLIMGLVAAVLWISCGVMLWDPWITFPNCFAMFVSFYAFYLCYKFPAFNDEDESKKRDCNDKAYTIEEDFAIPGSPDIERASPSPLQRALDFVSRSNSSGENLHLQDAKEKDEGYGGTCGTGGTGDSF